MTFSQIEYFLEVARTMNFHRAAENKFISQQVISRQVQALEQELDLKLFDRSNKRNLQLTEAGKILYEGWSKSVSEMNLTLQKAKNYEQERSNTVVLGIHAVSWIVDNAAALLQKFRKTDNAIKLETVVAGTAMLEEDLRKGDIDLLMTFSTEMVSADLSYRELGKVKIRPAIVISKNHALAVRKEVKIPDLENETLYLLKNSYSKDASRRVMQDFEYYNMSPARIEYFDNVESMEAKLMMGEGVCVGMDMMFRNKDRLKFYYFDTTGGLRAYDLVICWKDKKFEKLGKQLAKL